AVLEARLEEGREAILVAIHSSTPTYKDVPRPRPVGLIPGIDESLTRGLQAALEAESPDLNIGWSEPYAARKEVTHTVEEHGDRRGLPTTMIEIRHIEILEPARVALCSGRLARALEAARQAWLVWATASRGPSASIDNLRA